VHACYFDCVDVTLSNFSSMGTFGTPPLRAESTPPQGDAAFDHFVLSLENQSYMDGVPIPFTFTEYRIECFPCAQISASVGGTTRLFLPLRGTLIIDDQYLEEYQGSLSDVYFIEANYELWNQGPIDGYGERVMGGDCLHVASASFDTP